MKSPQSLITISPSVTCYVKPKTDLTENDMITTNNNRPTLLKNENKWWRFLPVFILTLLFGVFIVSCDKENESEPEDNNSPSDEYYVKYEVNSSTIYTGGKLDMTIRTEEDKNLTLVIDQRKLHETIIGPVEKGFVASMSVTAQGNTYDKLKLYTNIYVSKNGSPFALKKSDGSDEPRDFVQLSYKIDY